MKIVLVVLPIMVLLLGFITRRFSGRKELLKMDFIQFLYAFVLTPAIIIWIKTVVYFGLKGDLGLTLDANDVFLIDNILTIISLYIYSFVVIHSLTKTFEIRRVQDPLFDIFTHSEYFHLWLSHIVTYSGVLVLIFLFGLLNIFVPVSISVSRIGLNLGIVIGIVLSVIFYLAMWVYKVKEQKKFDRAMKFQVYVYTILLFTFYLTIHPKFTPSFAMFWCSAFFFVLSTVLSQTLRRGRK